MHRHSCSWHASAVEAAQSFKRWLHMCERAQCWGAWSHTTSAHASPPNGRPPSPSQLMAAEAVMIMQMIVYLSNFSFVSLHGTLELDYLSNIFLLYIYSLFLKQEMERFFNRTPECYETSLVNFNNVSIMQFLGVQNDCNCSC